MISKAYRFLILLTVLVMLVGCANVPRQDFNKAANNHLKKIAVITGEQPKEYQVDIIHHPGLSFGLVGGLVAAADMASKSSTFSEAAKPETVGLNSALKDSLQQIGATNNFELVFLDAPIAENNGFIQDYTVLKSDADAFLDVRFSMAGYRAQYPTSPYVPTLMAKAQMVDAKSNDIIYQATLHYGEPWMKIDGLVHVNADLMSNYYNFEALTNAADHATKALEKGAYALGDRISKDLQ